MKFSDRTLQDGMHQPTEVGKTAYCKVCKSSTFKLLDFGCSFCMPEKPFKEQPYQAQCLAKAIETRKRNQECNPSSSRNVIDFSARTRTSNGGTGGRDS